MLFNKGLALSGVMLAAAIPVPSAMVHAQTSQNMFDMDRGGVFPRVEGSAPVALNRPAAAAPAPSPAIIRSRMPAGVLPTVKAAQVEGPRFLPTVRPVVNMSRQARVTLSPRTAVIVAPVPAPVPAPVVAAPAPSRPEPSPVAAVVDVVVTRVGAAVDAAVLAVGTVVETAMSIVTPPPVAQQVVSVQPPAPPPVQPTPVQPAPVQPAPPPVQPAPAPVAPALAPPPVGQGVARVFTVSTMAELRTALTEAQHLAGAEIRLASGSYGILDWRSRSYPQGRVRIVAAQGAQPVFEMVNFSGSSNMLLSGVRVSGAGRPLLNLLGSSDMVIAGNRFTGANINQDPWDDTTTAVWLRTARSVTLSHNLFEDMRLAVFVQRASGVTIEHNTIRHVREGINVAATTDIDIRNNLFHSFSPDWAAGEHPDAIQFWTTNETTGSSNVRIVENAMLLGGCKAVQGIFIRSETERRTDGGPQIRHSNITIQRNVYFGSSRNGLSVSSVDGALVENNVVISSPYAESGISRTAAQAQDPRCGGALVPGILSRFGSTTHRFARNITVVLGSTEGARVDDIALGVSAGMTPWADAFARKPTADIPALSEFLTRNPSALRTRNIGLMQTFPNGQSLTGAAAAARGLAVHKR